MRSTSISSHPRAARAASALASTVFAALAKLAPFAAFAAFAAFLLPRTAHASSRELPVTYPYQTLSQGELEIEQYADVSPVRALSAEGTKTWVLPPAFQTEFEYGVTNHLELALYVVYMPGVAGYTQVPELGDTGLRQRVRYRFAEEGQLPVDIALYGEVSELTENLELEGKLILAKQLGDFHLMANVVGSRIVTYQGPGSWEISPSAGVSYQVNPTFHPGIEYWNKTEFPDDGGREFNDGPHHYLGPTMMFSFGKLWWSNGVYARLSDPHHTLDAGEAYGRVWARTIIGLNL